MFLSATLEIDTTLISKAKVKKGEITWWAGAAMIGAHSVHTFHQWGHRTPAIGNLTLINILAAKSVSAPAFKTITLLNIFG